MADPGVERAGDIWLGVVCGSDCVLMCGVCTGCAVANAIDCVDVALSSSCFNGLLRLLICASPTAQLVSECTGVYIHADAIALSSANAH